MTLQGASVGGSGWVTMLGIPASLPWMSIFAAMISSAPSSTVRRVGSSRTTLHLSSSAPSSKSSDRRGTQAAPSIENEIDLISSSFAARSIERYSMTCDPVLDRVNEFSNGSSFASLENVSQSPASPSVVTRYSVTSTPALSAPSAAEKLTSTGSS